jgi:hypothetical protein
VLLPQPAEAHGVLEGVGDFYAGLLHPVVVPGEALAIIAVGLLLGSSGVAACRLGLAALATGLLCGLALARGVVIGEPMSTSLLLGVAFVAAALVTVGLHLPTAAAAVLSLLGGVAVGLDARTEAVALFAVLTAGSGTVLGGTITAAVVCALVVGREKFWQKVASRVAGSWITASAILYFTWQMTARALLAGLVGSTLVATASPANACVICIPYPKETAADLVIKSDTVVFARVDVSKRYSYATVETLKGSAGDSVIPLLLDARTERQLQMDPGLRAVLAENRRGGTWTFLGVAGREYQAILRQVVDWDAKTPAERANFFAPYLRKEDRALANLAFLEVARAPYAVIRELKTDVRREGLYRVINDWFRVDWHGLYILMLGMSDRADDIDFVRGKLLATARFGLTTNLGAYATAYIEMKGVGAVRYLADEYLSARPHSDAELVEVVKALSTHGNVGRAELRAAVLDAYGRLLSHRPELAGHVANDLFRWRVTRFAARMREIFQAGVDLDEPSRLAVAAYLVAVDQTDAQSAVGAAFIP